MTNGSLMKVKSSAECSPWSILQYFWPALSNNQSWKQIFCRFTQVLLYVIFFLFLNQNNVVGTRNNHLNKMVLLITQNKC